jgi:Raf kinase inhibitor-like YbhB/YbcL family protein
MRAFVFAVAVSLLLALGCPVEFFAADFKLKSPAFQDGGNIPEKYTCQGRDLSPPLIWSGLPPETVSLALVCADPDSLGGDWVHWVIFNIPTSLSSLREGIPREGIVGGDARQGMNDFREIGYRGPCPPPGKPHRYHFKLYALDTEFLLPPGSSRDKLLQVMGGHILGTAQLVGLFGRGHPPPVGQRQR